MRRGRDASSKLKPNTDGSAIDASRSQISRAFKFNNFNQDPSILTVMSVEEQQNAELVVISRDNQRRAKWRFLRGALSDDGIEFVHPDGNVRMSFGWSDAASGRLSILPEGVKGNARTVTGSFARLDG